MGKYPFLFFVALLLASCSNRITMAFLKPGEAEVKQMVVAVGKDNPCGNFMNYVPDSLHPEYTPTKYIRMRFFMVRHDSQQLADFDMHKVMVYAKTMVNECNYRLILNAKMALPPGNNTPVRTINYRYMLSPNPNEPGDSGVKIIYDSLLGYANIKGRTNLFDASLYDKYGIQKDTVLNVFMLEHDPDSVKSHTYRAHEDGAGFSQWVKIVGDLHHLPELRKDPDGHEYYYGTNGRSGLMNHEVGHTLGLIHSWAGDDCPDTPDNPNCWDQNSGPCKKDGVYSNNMMDYNNLQWAVTPCQIAHMQYNMSKTNSSMRKLLLPTWCQYKPDSTIHITGNVVWNSAHDLEGDIVIENNASLTILCRVSLPKGARIIVEPKGALVVNGGEITNLCDENWMGIEVWKRKKDKGKVILANQPKITCLMHPLKL